MAPERKKSKKRKDEEKEDEDFIVYDEDILEEENEARSSANTNENNQSGFLNECKELFGTVDIYEILNLNKTATLIEIKKAYHKLSLKVHPDKVDDSLKNECTSKFQALGKIYTILSDEEKRRLYDETGVIDGENDFEVNYDWRVLFKRVTAEDINGFFQTYKDSPKEKEDLIRIYIKYEGDMNLIMQDMFSSSAIEDESRYIEILKNAIDNKEIEAFRKFTHESKSKKDKRRAKYEKEEREAEELKKEIGFTDDSDLKKVLAQRHEVRKQNFDNFFDNLAEKYCKKPAAAASTGRASKKQKK